MAMREILFRGKWTRNGKWIEGFYARIHDGKGNVSHRIYSGWAESDCGDFYPECFEVDPATASQYTGLTDKNGKKIFEGDIVKFTRINALGYTTRRTGDVRYYDKLPVFYIKATTGDAWDWCDCEAIEIIGNIHDNPELLEDGE